MHLEKLLAILEENEIEQPLECIRDMVKNGIVPERFTGVDDTIPNRQDITMFLAAWCRFAGLKPEDYQEWLITYCQDVLSDISSSSLSRIRHSTKSVIKYTEKSDVGFRCRAHYNIFKAACSDHCPLHSEMLQAYQQQVEEHKQYMEELRKQPEVPEPDPESLPVRKRYKPQYDEAVNLIKKYLDEGFTKQNISDLLNQKGFKTINGKPWKPGTVSSIAIMQGWSPVRRKKKSQKVED